MPTFQRIEVLPTAILYLLENCPPKINAK